MNHTTYSLLENYMLTCMDDSAHDKEHTYRVLYTALEIAKTEQNVNYDILIAACLLHDIGRREQFENPNLCHAIVGADKVYRFLIEHKFDLAFAEQVKHCISTHRYRKTNGRISIEAKILFGADKIDVVGLIGIARRLIYQIIIGVLLYSVLPDGTISSGEKDTVPSFFTNTTLNSKIFILIFTRRAGGNRRRAEEIGRGILLSPV